MTAPTATTIIAHGNCPDGFTAAWIMRQCKDWDPSTTMLVAAGYDDEIGDDGLPLNVPPPPDGTPWRVIIVDFAYRPEVLDAFAARTVEMLVLDHHETARAWLLDSSLHVVESTLNPYRLTGEQFLQTGYGQEFQLLNAVTHRAMYASNQSGAGLAARWLWQHQEWEAPRFVWSIEDRDLWRFERNFTREVFAAVTARPYDVMAYDQLAKMRFDNLIAEGRAVNMWRDRLVEQILDQERFILTLAGWYIPAVSAPYAVGSDVAAKLAEADPHGVGAYVVLNETGFRYGLRSTAGGPNVADIAREATGGGGHAHASGGVCVGFDNLLSS